MTLKYPAIIILAANILYAQYNPGKYNGSVDSRDFNELKGAVSLQVVLSDMKIDSIKISGYDFDIYHKVHGPLALSAKKSIPRKVLSGQSIKVDGVSGATVSSNSILLAIARALEKGYGGKLADGTFRGAAAGRKDTSHSGTIIVSVQILDGSITGITIDSIDQVTDHVRWEHYVKKAIRVIPDSVIRSQSLNVDAVSQATNTSNAILLAIARALENAFR